MIMHMNGFFAAHSDLDVDAPLYRIMPKKHLEQLLQTNTHRKRCKLLKNRVGEYFSKRFVRNLLD